MRKITLSLDEVELIRLRRILVDEDREEAWRFICDVLGKKAREAELPHCVPVFEASYKPRQAELITGLMSNPATKVCERNNFDKPEDGSETKG